MLDTLSRAFTDLGFPTREPRGGQPSVPVLPVTCVCSLWVLIQKTINNRFTFSGNPCSTFPHWRLSCPTQALSVSGFPAKDHKFHQLLLHPSTNQSSTSSGRSVSMHKLSSPYHRGSPTYGFHSDKGGSTPTRTVSSMVHCSRTWLNLTATST